VKVEEESGVPKVSVSDAPKTVTESSTHKTSDFGAEKMDEASTRVHVSKPTARNYLDAGKTVLRIPPKKISKAGPPSVN